MTERLSSPAQKEPLSEQKWRLSAACLRLNNTGLFFPPRGDMADIIQAKAVCATCPVKAECLEYGLHEPWGIWGGASARERRRIISQRAWRARATG